MAGTPVLGALLRYTHAKTIESDAAAVVFRAML